MTTTADLAMLLRLSATDIALGGAALSICSFLLAARLAWTTRFSPPKLVGFVSCLALYTFKSLSGKNTDRHLVPLLWITNTGAKPMLIQAIKLTILLQTGKEVALQPLHTVPMEAIDSPHTFTDFDALHIGQSPFSGIAVLSGEKWSSNLAFEVSADQYQQLKGNAKVIFSIQKLGSNRFTRAFQQQVVLDRLEFNWLKWADAGGPDVEYFYAHNDA